MAKKSHSLLGSILILVGIVLCVVGFFCAFAPGAVQSQEQGGVSVTATINLIGLMFGNFSVMASGSMGGITVDLDPVKINGGMSYCALISVILLALGVIIAALMFFTKRKILCYFSGLLILLSAILIFFSLLAGSDILITEGGEITQSFTDYMEGAKLGIAVYLYAIFNLLGAVVIVIAGKISKEFK